MLHYEVAMAVLQQGSSFLLQLRNGEAQTGGLGLIGAFGGSVEQGESPEQAACRELAEETNLSLVTDHAQFLGEVNVVSERHGEPITVHAHVFCFEIPEQQQVSAKEGEVVIMNLKQLRSSLHKLTPAMRACVNELMKEE